MQHCISSPSEATIKFRRIQIAQGPSCETDPLCLFSDFPLVAPKAVGVNLTCIRGKLVKKQSSMRAAISKIFLKAAGTHGRFPKPQLNIRKDGFLLFPSSGVIGPDRLITGTEKCDFPQHSRLQHKPFFPAASFRNVVLWWRGRNLRRCFGVLGKMAEKQDVRPSVASPCRGGPLGMLFHLPHLSLTSIHVPEHFTGIWAQGKPRQPGKSLITLELPISYDRYRGLQRFSKGATEWHLCSPEGLVTTQSDPSQRAESRSFLSFWFRAARDKGE